MFKSYVIKHKEGGYLYRTANNIWDRTVSFQKADMLPFEKARNILQNSISPAMRDMWEIVDAEEIDDPSCYKRTPFDDNGIDWESVSHAQCELYKNISQYRKNLSVSLSNVDKEVSDILHYIEFFTLDAAKGYKAYKMLKERVEKRRMIKDELLRINYFMEGNASDFSNGIVAKRIVGMDKRKYCPRVLFELFGLESKHDVNQSNIIGIHSVCN